MFVLCSLPNDWNYSWNKHCNLPFLAICRSLLHLLIFLAYSWYQKAKIGLQMIFQSKKWLIIILQDFIKQPVIKQSPTFPSFSFLFDCCISAFSLSLSKHFQIFIGKLSLCIRMEKLWKCSWKCFAKNL